MGYQRQPRRENDSELDELFRPVRDLLSGLRRGSGDGDGDDDGGGRRRRGGGGRSSGPQRPSIPVLRIAGILAVLVVLVWVGSGVYIVNPGEVAIVRTFGNWNGDQQTEGLHWRVPWPIQQQNTISIQEIRSTEIGFESIGEIGSGQGSRDRAQEARMITGDENLVDVQLVVQYRVRDAGAFLFNVKDPGASGLPDGETLRDASNSALRQVVGQRPIDDVLTTGKETVQVETQQLLQRLLDYYGTGIAVINVQLQDVQPPDEVQESFKDVISAREDRARFINEGQAYQEDIVPKARGDAARMVQAAEAFKVERVRQATGEANRFIERLREYRSHPEATRRRLYIEMMERILPRVDVVVVDEGIGGNVLPFLPLTDQGTPGA